MEKSYEQAIAAIRERDGPMVTYPEICIISPSQPVIIVLKDPHRHTIKIKEGFRLYRDVSLPFLITWVQTLIDKFLRDHPQRGKEEYLVQSVEITFPPPETNFEQSETGDFRQNRTDFRRAKRDTSSKNKKVLYPHLKGELAHPGANGSHAAYVKWVVGGPMEQYWMVLRNKVQFAGRKPENEIPILTVHTIRRRADWHQGERLKKQIGVGHDFIMGDEVFGTYEFFVQKGISELLIKILAGDETINSLPGTPQAERRGMAPTNYAKVVDLDDFFPETPKPLPSTEDFYPETMAPTPSPAEVLHQAEVSTVSHVGELDDEEFILEIPKPIPPTEEILYLKEPDVQSFPANYISVYLTGSARYRTYVSMNKAWESVSNTGAVGSPSIDQSPSANDRSAHSTSFAQYYTHSQTKKACETANELQSPSTYRNQLRTRRARGDLRREALSASLHRYDKEDSPPQETLQLDTHTEELPQPIETPDHTDDDATIGTACIAQGGKKAILIDLKRKWKTNDPEIHAEIARDLAVGAFSETTDDDESFQSQENYEPSKEEDISKEHTIVKSIAAVSLSEADDSKSFQSQEERYRPSRNEDMFEASRRIKVTPASSWEEVRPASKRGVSASKREGCSKAKLQKSRNKKKRKCRDSISEKLCYEILTTHTS